MPSRSRHRRHITVLVLLVGSLLCPARAQQLSPITELRVLFIGNSLTYANDLPAIIEALAASQQKKLIHKSVAFPNFSLQDHWEKGDAQRAIAGGKWDFVLLQQGPSALEESRHSLLDYTRRFDNLIRAAGATPALYMVWPSRARFGDFDRVMESYQLAAEDVHGILLPVGAAWVEAWKDYGQLPLYAEDQFHPSAIGSYLAALVIYEKLFGVSPMGLPATLRLRSAAMAKIDIPTEQARRLQIAARAANRRFD